MRRFERRAFVTVTADDEAHAFAMFEKIDGMELDTHSDVPGYAASVSLDDGEMEEVDDDDSPAESHLRVVPPPLRLA